MSYFDLYKKKLMNNGGSATGELLNLQKMRAMENFKNDPSYRKAKLAKLDLTEEELDIRVVNIDNSVADKKIYLQPDLTVEEGSLIKYRDKTFIITEFEDNLVSPMCKGTLCEHKINIPNTNTFFPCLIEGESYGVKIVGGTDFFGTVDTKIKVTVQANELTKTIRQNYRFVIGNSQYGIYEVGDVTVYNKGMLVFICKKAEYLEGLDDLENNIAFNGIIEDGNTENPTSFEIIGNDSIKINNNFIYKLNSVNTDVIFSLDDYTIENNIAAIISQANGECTIKANISDEIITLNCSLNDEIVASKDIVTVKR